MRNHAILPLSILHLVDTDVPFRLNVDIPFRLNVAALIFQRKLHQVHDDLEGIACIADDITVIGNGDNDEEARENHEKALLSLLKKCEETGIKLKIDKVQ